MSDYKINVDNTECPSVDICLGECDYLKSFISIFVDEEEVPSPFKTVEDAKLFAEIIIKLLEVNTNGSS